jgi:hypothetical protein
MVLMVSSIALMGELSARRILMHSKTTCTGENKASTRRLQANPSAGHAGVRPATHRMHALATTVPRHTAHKRMSCIDPNMPFRQLSRHPKQSWHVGRVMRLRFTFAANSVRACDSPTPASVGAMQCSQPRPDLWRTTLH